ncbi:hypothetical protein CMI39_01500 [Candidatus Pacearchaeota archaeon]|jgi:radical SAM superfamily enzyme YgiQ (UPF0313 family)|nr:hypothetical protein [Candidatus Pacearchaeota archaeon]|tara:strand:+ start:7191 stop:8663 length:1473 start_codon:yes stop_codon:yes gene_type:complete
MVKKTRKNIVILIQPKVGYLDSVKTNYAIPLALLYVASMINKDYEVIIFDQRIHTDWEKEIDKLLEKNPICIGLTSMTGEQLYYALDISKRIKSKGNYPVVWGGIHPTLDSHNVLKNKNVDIVVRGEGEETFKELINNLEKNKSLKSVKGISFKDNGKIINNPERGFIDLNTLPEIPYNLIDLEKYTGKYKGRRSLHVQLSRGCPFSCTYCYNSIFNKSRWRTLSAENAFKVISVLYHKHNIRYFDFLDDNLFVNLDRMEKIADNIIINKMDIIWKGTLEIPSSKRMNEKYFRKMSKAGLERLEIGVESGSNRILKLVNKPQKIEDVFELNKKISKFNITPGYNFVVGFPTETKEDVKLTLNSALKLLKENPNAEINGVYCYTPYPGTPLYNNLGKFGFIPPKSIEGWIEYSGDKIKTPWVDSKEKKRLSNIQFASYFLNQKGSNLLDVKKTIKILSKLYEPIARARFKFNFFNLMIEHKFLSFYKKLID